jgi:glyoxylase-like metal-dependent hydrolase (beta-lactamase superfamily II)
LRTRSLGIACSIATLAFIAFDAHGQSPYPLTTGHAYKFAKIADGVYYATATGAIVTGSNNVVIVGNRDTLVVDTGTTPAAARAFLDDVKLVTDKPIRYVVNTHFHYDHTDGNQVYAGKADIIAHEYVKDAIEHLNVLQREPYKTNETNAINRVNTLTTQIAAEQDATRRAAFEKDLATARQNVTELKEIRPTPPNVTYAKKKVIDLGNREVQLLFLGRGHTNGDTVVYLPREKVVCSGDLMESQVAYMGDAQFSEWLTTLDALKKLDFETDLPGHGVPFKGKELITAFQSYLRDLMMQGATLRAQGVSAEEAAMKVDLTSHARDFPQIRGAGAEVRGMRRLYAWMDEQHK